MVPEVEPKKNRQARQKVVQSCSMEQRESESPPADVLVTGYNRETYGYATYRSHGSGNWLITYTLQGKGCYRQPGTQIWSEPGAIVLLRPGAVHDYTVPPDNLWHFHWAHFQPRLNWFAWWQFPEVGQGLYKVQLLNPQAQERIRLAFTQLHLDTSLSSPFQTEPAANVSGMLQKELALNRLEEILLISMQHIQAEKRPLDPRVKAILEYIAQDLSIPHTLDALAQRVSLSPSRLSHLFKQEVGDSVLNMILTIRLNQATRLLEFSSQSISRIAEEVGFGSLYYFSRQFRQRFGQSPRAYRQKTTGQKISSPS